VDTPELTRTETIRVAADPAAVYALVTDIGRTGDWSPVCTTCDWDDPAAGAVLGATFTGHNSSGGRSWTTRCEVVAAEPGREFAWEVNGGLVRWGYRLAPVEGGTELTESWEFTPVGIAVFTEKYGDAAPGAIENRAAEAHAGIPATLAALKRIAEAG
jgi:hypothetical protein